MTTPTAQQTDAQPRGNGIDSAAKLVLSIFLVPAPFELVTAFTKRESYDYRRLLIVGGVLAVLAVVVVIWQRRHARVQSAIGIYLIAVGLAVTALGVILTFVPDLLLGSVAWTPALETSLSSLTPALGLLLIAAGVYLFRDQMRRARDEADAPSPRTIANPRPIRLGDHNGSVWRSEHFGEHPAAEGMVDICKSRLDPMNLHFVAYFTADDQCLFYVDMLDDDSVRRFNVRNTAQRRRHYEQAGRHARGIIRRLDRRWRGLESGDLVRVVFDVTEGALYFYKLRDVGYLLGVTLDQTEVDPTDRAMSELANELLPYLGRRPSDDFHRK